MLARFSLPWLLMDVDIVTTTIRLQSRSENSPTGQLSVSSKYAGFRYRPRGGSHDLGTGGMLITNEHYLALFGYLFLKLWRCEEEQPALYTAVRHPRIQKVRELFKIQYLEQTIHRLILQEQSIISSLCRYKSLPFLHENLLLHSTAVKSIVYY
jgi:hypothetical protein